MATASSERVKRPLNGKEFLESIRDDREVWVYGERVKDVTAHPGFRNAARMIARMYDSLHDPAKKQVLTTPTDTGSGGFTHPYYKVSRTVDELVAAGLLHDTLEDTMHFEFLGDPDRIKK